MCVNRTQRSSVFPFVRSDCPGLLTTISANIMRSIVRPFAIWVMLLAFGLGATAMPAEIIFSEPVVYEVEGQLGSLASADFDGINGPDLVTGTNAATVAFLLNNGDGTFTLDGTVGIPSGLPISNQILAMDFDGVKGPDVATANFRTHNVSVLLNNGNATFAPLVTYPVGILEPLVEGIAGADFDGINGPDIAVTNVSFEVVDANSVSVLFNNGDGTFSAAVNYPLGILGPHNIAAADFDGVNGPDLAVSNRDNNSVIVFLNKGDGAFELPLSFSAPGAPNGTFVAADLDGINGPDLATQNFFDSVGVLLNNGDGTFAPTVTYAASRGRSLAAADFDGDRDLDLVAVSSDSNNVSVLPNNGDGTFMPFLSVPIGHTTDDVVAEDFDGVKGPDLAVADADPNLSIVSVLLNEASIREISIYIKPGNKRNIIKPCAKGGIWVALLSDSEFDPLQIDIPTVRFGPDGAKAIRHKVKDINHDGLGDLLLRFKILATGIACGDTEATLTGKTFDGQIITGTDSIKTVGCKPKKHHKKKHHKKHHDDDHKKR
jgi:hypothetical protein